jgi:nitroreductase
VADGDLDAIRARRNVRAYTPEPVPDEHLTRIAEAGWRAPSASNRQHWDFVVVTARERLPELASVWQGAGHITGAAAAIVLVLPVSVVTAQSSPVARSFSLSSAPDQYAS